MSDRFVVAGHRLIELLGGGVRLQHQLRAAQGHCVGQPRACEIMRIISFGTLPCHRQHVLRGTQCGDAGRLERLGANGRQRCGELRGRAVQAGPEGALSVKRCGLGRFGAGQLVAHQFHLPGELGLQGPERGLRVGAQSHQPVVGAHHPEQQDGEQRPQNYRAWHAAYAMKSK